MAGTIVRPSIVGGRQLRDVAKALRAAGRTDLQRETTRAVKDASKATLDNLRHAARRVRIAGIAKPGRRSAYGGPSTAKHLRERMAAATVVEVRTGARETRVSYTTKGSRLGSASTLPRRIDSGKPWRHPIMGNRGSWASQRGEPWFFAPIKAGLKETRADISAALDGITDKIEKV